MLKHRLSAENLFRFIDLLEVAGMKAEDIEQMLVLGASAERIVEAARHTVEAAQAEHHRKLLSLYEITKWGDDDWVALTEHPSLGPGIRPIAARRSRLRVRELALAKGVSHPWIVPGRSLRRGGDGAVLDGVSAEAASIVERIYLERLYLARNAEGKIIALAGTEAEARRCAAAEGVENPIILTGQAALDALGPVPEPIGDDIG